MSSSPGNQLLREEQTKELIQATVDRLSTVGTWVNRRARFNVDFCKIRQLGVGGEGSVSAMVHKPTGTLYAVKTVKQRYGPAMTPLPHNEVRILSLLMNVGEGKGLDNICKPADDSMWYPCTPEFTTQAIVLEYCELGSLHDYMSNDCWIDADPDSGINETGWRIPHEGLLRHLYTQMLAGLAFLHNGYGTTAFGGPGRPPIGRPPIIHRDLKPENVLVCPAKPGDHPALLTVKLSDFGGAAEVGAFPRARALDDGLYFFTTGYFAPEFLEPGVSRSSANMANDVFSIGATMYFCIYGAAPFVRDPERNVMHLRRRDMRKQTHRGGEALSHDFAICVCNAVTFAQNRKDAMTILERVRRDSPRYKQEFIEWMDEIEGPRIAKEEQEACEREAREAEKWEKLERDAVKVLPLMCFDPLCCDVLLPHTHRCRDAEQCYLANVEGHSHILFALQDTWADIRTHLVTDLDVVPLEEIKRALLFIELKAEAMDLLNGEAEDEDMAEVPDVPEQPWW
ncbi:serine threonine-protein kinase [Diplodia corticola]|uniref:Serine threonine-protein kinase n=1 Tax=Diplodia corticola TaxID=236234 RepID=A0A1J9SKJ6_9PEZI|nr:serine threonine-protein kinase [Diplodia corticola]OJD40268.1 serine threonine-protein kinase [Diplodia corticola]